MRVILLLCVLAARLASPGGGAAAQSVSSVSSTISGAWNSATSTVGSWASDVTCAAEKLAHSFDVTPCQSWVLNATCPSGCSAELNKVGRALAH